MRLFALLTAVSLALSAYAAPAFAAVAGPGSGTGDQHVEDAKADTVEALVLRFLQAGMDGSFERYLAEVHPDRRSTAEQKSQLMRYEWKRFSRQASWYVPDPKKPSFTVERRQNLSETKVRLYIKDYKNTDAMPRPIELVKWDGRWVVNSNSL
jgi:hypothetical protein